MVWLRNPKKKIRSILIKIGQGRVSEADIASLMELLDRDPSAVPEVLGALAGILNKDNTKAYSSVITILNMAAEKEPELVAGILDAVMGCIRRGKEVPEDWILGSLEILIKISQKYPEKLGCVISDLIMCLENMSVSVREKSYFLLAYLAILQPGVFNGHSKDLVRALNGLNIDERIYSCRLIKKIAEKDPKIVESTYGILEDLSLNHLDSNLRSEAAYAVETLNIIKQKPSGSVKANKVTSEKKEKIMASCYLIKDMPEASDINFSELVELIDVNKKDIENILNGLGLEHMIVKK
ncbi:Uncharacterised protein [uncultured archaeon]|nr:Uncharacterised protein [uncultured archaeon]